MISYNEAAALIRAAARDWGAENCPLEECAGRVLAAPVMAGVSLPERDCSAMDGYAVRFDDVRESGNVLTVTGEAAAGDAHSLAIFGGETVRIFTGGILPDGADHILIQEDATRKGDTVRVEEAQDGPRHVRKAGLDFSKCDTLIQAGTVLGPAEIALAAAGDNAMLRVRKKPKVGLISNGDELRRPGESPRPGSIINSNFHALSSLVQQWGGEPVDLGISPDDRTALARQIETASGLDILVTTGGASVGEYDHLHEVLGEKGMDYTFRKVAIKPGKPVSFGSLGTMQVLGLPGNPASAYVCAHLFLYPLIRQGAPLPRGCARLAHDVRANGSRETFTRGRLDLDTDGGTQVTVHKMQDSALLHPFLDSNVLVRLAPHSPAKKAGDMADLIFIKPVTGPSSHE